MPSKGFQEQEDQRHNEEVASDSAKIDNKTKIFWSRASQLVIGNFVEAEYSGGRMIRAEQGLRFYASIKTTAIQKEIDYIRNSNAFECGDCREVATMEEARKLIAQQNALKGVKHTEVSDITSTDITLT